MYVDDVPDPKLPGEEFAVHRKMGFAVDGGVAVLRPDGHVACTVALEEAQGTVEALEGYFKRFLNGRGQDKGRGRLGRAKVSAHL